MFACTKKRGGKDRRDGKNKLKLKVEAENVEMQKLDIRYLEGVCKLYSAENEKEKKKSFITFLRSEKQ